MNGGELPSARTVSTTVFGIGADPEQVEDDVTQILMQMGKSVSTLQNLKDRGAPWRG